MVTEIELTTYTTSFQGILKQLDDIIVDDALAIEALRPSDKKAFG